jgi:hypothetical protein
VVTDLPAWRVGQAAEGVCSGRRVRPRAGGRRSSPRSGSRPGTSPPGQLEADQAVAGGPDPLGDVDGIARPRRRCARRTESTSTPTRPQHRACTAPRARTRGWPG